MARHRFGSAPDGPDDVAPDEPATEAFRAVPPEVPDAHGPEGYPGAGDVDESEPSPAPPWPPTGFRIGDPDAARIAAEFLETYFPRGAPPPPAVDRKVKAATIAGAAAVVLGAIASAVLANLQLLDAWPSWAQFLVVAVFVPAASAAAGYMSHSDP